MSARRAVLLVLWLATAVAAGWLLSRALPEDERRAVVDRETAPKHESRPSDPPAASTPEDPETRDEELGPACFEVSVVREDGTPVRANVYALPAGAPGAYLWEVTNASHEPPGPCRLVVPRPGVYDIGCRTDSPHAHAMVTDVAVGPGDTSGVTLRLAKGAPVTISLEPGLRLGDLVTDGWVMCNAFVFAKGIDAPGRDELPDIHEELKLEGTGPWGTAALPPGRSYRVAAQLRHVRDIDSIQRIEPMPVRLVADPEHASAGARVVLRRAPGVLVILRFEREEERSWTTYLLRLRFELAGAEGKRVLGAGADDEFLSFVTAPGPARVRWTGDGVAPGEIDLGDLSEGAVVERTIGLRPGSRTKSRARSMASTRPAHRSGSRSSRAHPRVAPKHAAKASAGKSRL